MARVSAFQAEGCGIVPRHSLHVAVVQLVEHQIVALVVVDSSSTGHPIYKGRHSNFYFYKTLIFGLRESLINICLVNKKLFPGGNENEIG